jgi:long-chain-fatty-acid--[acyl-carrier-protein] ligase
VEIRGLEQLAGRQKGILFLPNHAAYIDNPILLIHLWPRFAMHPVAGARFHRVPILGALLRWTGALAIHDLKKNVNGFKIRQTQQVLEEIVAGLRRGENFMLSPAGQTKSGSKEVLGASSGVHAIMSRLPEVDVALIRVTGLWGSSFSRVITGVAPVLGDVVWAGIKAVIKNGLLFTPRRKVTIEIVLNPPQLPRRGSRLELNRFLEDWYNQYPLENGERVAEEPLVLVPYQFWSSKTLEVRAQSRSDRKASVIVSDEVREKVYREIRRIAENPALKVVPESSLALDLGFDSINLAELMAYLSRHFSAKDLELESLKMVQDVLDAAAGAAMGSSGLEEAHQVPWPEEPGRPSPEAPRADTVARAFLEVCDRMGDAAAMRDETAGILSYRKTKRAALVLAEYLRRFPEERIGLLLPASCGAAIVYLALLLANKVPVFINWTLGPRYVEEMVKISGVDRILSSWKFLDRAPNVDWGDATGMAVLLEDVREALSLRMKLRGLFLSWLSAAKIAARLQLREGVGAILFTSGSEAVPKAVPLSNRNLLYAPGTVVPFIGPIFSSDCLFGLLPPFHVFGLVFAILTPVLSGARVAFYPNPTDGRALAERIDRWCVTILPSAPTFLKGLFALANSEQMRSLRWIFSGAEKAPPELKQRIEELGVTAEFMEGYGITECSGIVSLNRPDRPKKGVGQIGPGTEVCTVHPETKEVLTPGTEGELCVRGPGVFQGYLGDRPAPFLEARGKIWYRTGDLGFVDNEGYVTLSGRLKRFVKIGGEMVSLGAIEEALGGALIERGMASLDAPAVAVCPAHDDSHLVVFATAALDKESANEILRQRGFSNLIKISSVKKVEEIPMMSTGKTNYRKLQGLV